MVGGTVVDGGKTEAVDDGSQWGSYKPDLAVSTSLMLTRYTPMGFGGARKMMRNMLLRRGASPIDATIWGKRVRAYLTDNRCEWKAFLNPEFFDPVERSYIRRFMDRPQAVFLDIGANVGFITLYAASVSRPDARLLAFEPHPVTYRRLAYNLTCNGDQRITAYATALGASDGFARMNIDDLSLSSLSRGGDGVEVPVTTLMKVLGTAGIAHIDVLKIDVEGAEGQVLAPFLDAAPDALLPRCVIIEHLARGHTWTIDCVEALTARGLRVDKVVGNNTILVRD